MPIEPLSITAAVIGITRLTYDSCKSLNDTIKTIKSAPQQLKDLEKDLETFQNVIKPAETDLARCGAAESELSLEQRASLQALEPVMGHCKVICDRFSLRLTQLTSHSSEHRTALRDRIRLNFHESDVQLLKENMAQCQRTLSDALGFANLFEPS
ncbi:hypothetical protein BD289DRAFT_454113 [Coniella lustricola]|uniref:Azaphilone pigments biosynthesis cluster protein L N-terminal domain-containing protein n=1 Tax=Coniella lustricola TaxID=2025994 RepID=A0A2T3A4S7_9PEZI|nr:hypothetical protein BD289DRAFT_454113 [Coniella lustricola]